MLTFSVRLLVYFIVMFQKLKTLLNHTASLTTKEQVIYIKTSKCWEETDFRMCEGNYNRNIG